MKFKSLLCISLAALAVSASAQEVVFDFSKSADINQFTYVPLTLSELRTSTYINASNAEKPREYASNNNYVLILEGETVSKDGVGISLSNPDKYKDFPRFFFGLIKTPKPAEPTAEHYYCDLRWYQTEELKFTAPEGKKFDKIVMYAECGTYPVRQNNETFVVGEIGKQTFTDMQGNEGKTVNTWEADGAVVSELTYKGGAESATQMAYSIHITLSNIDGSSVAELANDDNAPTEYFDLTGAKRNADNLAPGIYVKRQGAKATKVIVK